MTLQKSKAFTWKLFAKNRTKRGNNDRLRSTSPIAIRNVISKQYMFIRNDYYAFKMFNVLPACNDETNPFDNLDSHSSFSSLLCFGMFFVNFNCMIRPAISVSIRKTIRVNASPFDALEHKRRSMCVYVCSLTIAADKFCLFVVVDRIKLFMPIKCCRDTKIYKVHFCCMSPKTNRVYLYTEIKFRSAFWYTYKWLFHGRNRCKHTHRKSVVWNK